MSCNCRVFTLFNIFKWDEIVKLKLLILLTNWNTLKFKYMLYIKKIIIIYKLIELNYRVSRRI